MKNTVVTIQQMKEKGEKISMLTAYDYSTAKLEDEAGVNTILVGDSLGNVILGYEDTISVTMEDMIHQKTHLLLWTCRLCRIRHPFMMRLSMPDV